MTAGEWTWLARIRRPQGRKGEVFAEILTDFPEKFAERRRLWLLPEREAGAESEPPSAPKPASTPREVSLSAFWLHKGGVVLHFTGTGSISDAESLAGLIVAVPRPERVALAEDEAYMSDLVGCTLADVAGPAPKIVGEIVDVDSSCGPVPLLTLRGADGEILIPFAKSYLRELDLKARLVEMALPEGLADLNADLSAQGKRRKR
jgi:16S rRNA processing protein RimM